MTPYYDQDGITIYHGDCREIDLPGYDSVLTDPPYGIDWSPDNARFTSKPGNWWTELDRSRVSRMEKIRGDAKPFDPSQWTGKPAVLWGANHYASRLQDSGGWLVWDKRKGLEGVEDRWPLSEAELAWTNTSGRVSIFRMRWFGLIRPQSERDRFHPNQKPLALMAWCLKFLPAGVVLDPFMGSGTTLVACRDNGVSAVGIEIEERYCEIAARRLSQMVIPEVAAFGENR